MTRAQWLLLVTYAALAGAVAAVAVFIAEGAA